MSGLDKIIAHIRDEAAAEAAEIRRKAEAEAAAIKDAGEKRADALCGEIEKKAKTDAAGIAERGSASAALCAKQILLAEKQSLINAAIAKAKEELYALPAEAYFEKIEALFRRHLPNTDAVIAFSKEDMARLPQGFAERLSGEAEKNGAKLTLSETPAAISGGFVLDFGGVEENCSFEALLEDAAEKLQDRVKELLFA